MDIDYHSGGLYEEISIAVTAFLKWPKHDGIYWPHIAGESGKLRDCSQLATFLSA